VIRARSSWRPDGSLAGLLLVLSLVLLAGCGPRTLPEVSGTWLDGSPFKTSDLRGRNLWLEFWAPWDPASLQRLQDLEGVLQRRPEWRSRLVFVAVSGAAAGVNEALPRTFRRTGRVVLDTGPIGLELGVEMVPTTVWVGSDGQYRVVRQGYVEPARLEQALQPLLGTTAP